MLIQSGVLRQLPEGQAVLYCIEGLAKMRIKSQAEPGELLARYRG